MSELPTGDKLKALHAEIDDIYSSPEVLEHMDVVRAISQEVTRSKKPTTNIHAPEFFGEWSEPATSDHVPDND